MCVFFFVIDWRKGNLSVWPIGDADLGKTHYLLLWCLQPLNRECVCVFFFFEGDGGGDGEGHTESAYGPKSIPERLKDLVNWHGMV